jgi:glycerate-2-kinase
LRQVKSPQALRQYGKDEVATSRTITKPSLTEEEARFIAETQTATEETRQRVERDGIDPVFLTKRWLEKTGFPVGIILDHELAEAEFWRRTRSRAAW